LREKKTTKSLKQVAFGKKKELTIILRIEYLSKEYSILEASTKDLAKHIGTFFVLLN